MKPTLLAAAASLALAVPGGLAFAQEAVVARDASGNTVVLTAEQQVLYDAWPADRRTSYDAWPDTYRTYYWTLSPDQQTGWWALTDEQRTQVYAMTPEQRTAAWASIATQMSAATPPADSAATADASAPADSAADADASAPSGSAADANAAADAAAASDAPPTADMATTPDAGTSSTTMAATGVAATSSSTGEMQFVRKETTQTVAATADPAALASGDLPVCKAGQQDGCINGWEKNKTGNKPLSYWPGKPASEIPGAKPDAAPAPQ